MPKFGVAQSVRRVEDPRLLKGAGHYTDDIAVVGMAHGIVLRSPYAAARITAIDTSAARAAAGVLAVYTHEDLEAEGIGGIPCIVPLENRDGSQRADVPHPALVGHARHVGDPVAFIVAETLDAGRDAAELIDVTYEAGNPITDLARVLDDGAPLVWPSVPQNIAFDWAMGDTAAVDALFAGAAHVTKLTVINNRIIVNSMEPRAALAEYDGERFTLTANTQGGWLVRDQLADAVFNLPADRIRVITPDVGGAFGMKAFLYNEHILVCFAARKLGRPVKWASERGEAFQSDTHGRDHITDGELALDKDGTFLAMRVRNVANMGAYLSNYAPFIPTLAGSTVLASVYGFKAVYLNVIGVFTNTVPVDAYRGAGRPESNYLVERLIDTAARELGIDRVEIRRRNMVKPEAMPYTSAMGQTYDSGDFEKVLDSALEQADWAGFEARRAESASSGKWRGIGFSYYLEATGGGPEERAEIRFAADGNVDLYVGTQSAGQGHETAYVQLVSQRLGIPGEAIRVRQGDTETIPMGGGTGGARSLYSQGMAIYATTDSVVEKGKQAASEILEASPSDIVFEAGSFTIVGTDRKIDILELAKTLRSRVPGTEIDGAGMVASLDTAEVVAIQRHTFPNGCHVAEVEIDPETGVVAVLRYLVCDDVGRAVNPMIVRGQVHGGVAQGIGQALLERTAYDAETGQLVSGSLMDYALPRADDLPDIDVDFIEVPCLSNPLGVKGAGEAGAVGSPPAVVNAIVDALAGIGVRSIDMPATPERVWQAIHENRRAA